MSLAFYLGISYHGEEVGGTSRVFRRLLGITSFSFGGFYISNPCNDTWIASISDLFFKALSLGAFELGAGRHFCMNLIPADSRHLIFWLSSVWWSFLWSTGFRVWLWRLRLLELWMIPLSFC
jgi:hypothetical protein